MIKKTYNHSKTYVKLSFNVEYNRFKNTLIQESFNLFINLKYYNTFIKNCIYIAVLLFKAKLYLWSIRSSIFIEWSALVNKLGLFRT